MYSYQLPTYSSISPNHHVVLTFIPFLPSHHSYIPTKSSCPCIHTNHTPFFYSHPLTMSLHSYHTQHFYTPTKSTFIPHHSYFPTEMSLYSHQSHTILTVPLANITHTYSYKDIILLSQTLLYFSDITKWRS